MASTRNLDQLNAIANACSANCDGLDSNGEILDNLAMLAEAGQLSGDGTIVVDSALDETSVAPVQNRVIARLIPAEANSGNRLTDKAYVDTGLAGKADVDHTHDNSALETAIDNKVDKIEGKGLSTEDFTTAEKERLASLHNYDDTDLQNSVANKVDKEDGKGLSTNDYTTEEKEKLASLSNYDDTEIQETIATKVDAEYVNTSIETALSTGYVIPKKAIDASPYAKIGEAAGLPAGYIRKYNDIKKIVFIGNSMTWKAYADYWQVDDNREGAASTPTSGWIHRIYDYLRTNFYPDLEVYKVAGNSWETKTEGTRDYATHLAGNSVCKLTPEGQYVVDGLTLDQVLDENVDIIICQVYENVGGVIVVNDFIKDYINLYGSLKNKCPNADIYQFCGMWQQERARTWCVINAAEECNVHPIVVPDFFIDHKENYKNFYAKAGDEIYDAEGNVIHNVTETFANHPNDKGFLYMAGYTLFALFNNVSSKYQNRISLSFTDDELTKPYSREISMTAGTLTNLSEFNAKYASWLGYYYLPGKYDIMLTLPNYWGHTRGTLKVYLNKGAVADFDIYQEFIPTGVAGELVTNDIRFFRAHNYGQTSVPNFAMFNKGELTQQTD